MKIYKAIIIGLLVFCDSSFGNWTSPLDILRKPFRDVEVARNGISLSLPDSGGRWLIINSQGSRVGKYGERVEVDQYGMLAEKHRALRIAILEIADGSRVLLVEDRFDSRPFGGGLKIDYYTAVLGGNNELLAPSSQVESLAIDLFKSRYPRGNAKNTGQESNIKR
ncbi:MAG: hypothetical protein BGO12_18300 [Verrucomicrobia bacterium 61-8]|nr:MAG: hypothetical protein BGO12_18300 [Verrucomicrobia bacterium 61-8]